MATTTVPELARNVHELTRRIETLDATWAAQRSELAAELRDAQDELIKVYERDNGTPAPRV